MEQIYKKNLSEGDVEVVIKRLIEEVNWLKTQVQYLQGFAQDTRRELKGVNEK